jgi:hypothetical protein
VELHPLDGYLLDGRPAKGEAIAAALRQRSADPRAQPFYRALDALGARAADEALLALRLVLAGKPTDDETIRSLRDLRKRAQGGDATARSAYFQAIGMEAG